MFVSELKGEIFFVLWESRPSPQLFCCLSSFFIIVLQMFVCKGKGKVRPRTGHESPEGE